VNIQDYISSGIIESYVLGLASPDVRIEFEQLCLQYPELIEARKRFEESIEKQTMEDAPIPPESVKEKIWSAIQEEPKVISMDSTRRRSNFPWLAAASIVLLLIAGFLAIKYYTQNKKLRDDLDIARKTQQQLDKQMKDMEEEKRIMNDPNVTVVNMKTMKGDASSANVFWDSTSSNVYMVVKNMPKLPTNKQYELWALINKATTPISLGQFDGGEKIMLKMNDVKKADAFAITIEDRGNTGGPNLNAMQSMTRLQ
jgi:anti-sigma-K factor RskA